MPVVLHMHAQEEPLTWQAFVERGEPFSVALDGYVAAGPRFDPSGPYININHHEEVVRLATRATCAQVLIAIRQGFFMSFRDEDGLQAQVYCNDCDEDVCLSWFLLKYGYLAEHTLNPMLNRLVSMEDLLDATAGAYPFPANLPFLGELAWIFAPYRQLRLSGELDRKNSETYSNVVIDVEHRIMQHLTGNGGSQELDTRYETIGGGEGWALIRELGGQARTGLFSDGVCAYVSVRERPDGRWTYTIGRMSMFVPFDVPRILTALDAVESDDAGHWGGGDTIGGSPRVQGSALPPDEVVRIVNEAR